MPADHTHWKESPFLCSSSLIQHLKTKEWLDSTAALWNYWGAGGGHGWAAGWCECSISPRSIRRIVGEGPGYRGKVFHILPTSQEKNPHWCLLAVRIWLQCGVALNRHWLYKGRLIYMKICNRAKCSSITMLSPNYSIHDWHLKVVFSPAPIILKLMQCA